MGACSQGGLVSGGAKAKKLTAPQSQAGTRELAERRQGVFHQQEAAGTQLEGGAKGASMQASQTPEGPHRHPQPDVTPGQSKLQEGKVPVKRKQQGFPGGSVVKNRLPMQETQVQSLVQEDPTCPRVTKPVHQNY